MLIDPQELLRDSIKVEALKEKAKKLERFAYDSPAKNRVIGSEGHEATVNYIVDTLKQYPDYYNVTLQDVPLNVGVSANVTILGEETDAYAVGFAPSGSATGNLVVIPNLGCEEVSCR